MNTSEPYTLGHMAMTKAAVKGIQKYNRTHLSTLKLNISRLFFFYAGMDAVQNFTLAEKGIYIKNFVVTGMSKVFI
jgi:hypothetical protein